MTTIQPTNPYGACSAHLINLNGTHPPGQLPLATQPLLNPLLPALPLLPAASKAAQIASAAKADGLSLKLSDFSAAPPHSLQPEKPIQGKASGAGTSSSTSLAAASAVLAARAAAAAAGASTATGIRSAAALDDCDEDVLSPSSSPKHSASAAKPKGTGFSSKDQESLFKDWKTFETELKEIADARFTYLANPAAEHDPATIASKVKQANLLLIENTSPASVVCDASNRLTGKAIFEQDSEEQERYFKIFKKIINAIENDTVENLPLEIAKKTKKTKNKKEKNVKTVRTKTVRTSVRVAVSKYACYSMLLAQKGIVKTIYAQWGTQLRSVVSLILSLPPFAGLELPANLKLVGDARQTLSTTRPEMRLNRTQALRKEQNDLFTDEHIKKLISDEGYQAVAATIKPISGRAKEVSKECTATEFIDIKANSIVYDEETNRVVAVFKKKAYTQEELAAVKTELAKSWKAEESGQDQMFGYNFYPFQAQCSLSKETSKSPALHKTLVEVNSISNRLFSVLLPKTYAQAVQCTEIFRKAGLQLSDNNPFLTVGVHKMVKNSDVGKPKRDLNYHHFSALTTLHMKSPAENSVTATHFFEVFKKNEDGKLIPISFHMSPGDLLLADGDYAHGSGKLAEGLQRANLVSYCHRDISVGSFVRHDSAFNTAASASSSGSSTAAANAAGGGSSSPKSASSSSSGSSHSSSGSTSDRTTTCNDINVEDDADTEAAKKTQVGNKRKIKLKANVAGAVADGTNESGPAQKRLKTARKADAVNKTTNESQLEALRAENTLLKGRLAQANLEKAELQATFALIHQATLHNPYLSAPSPLNTARPAAEAGSSGTATSLPRALPIAHPLRLTMDLAFDLPLRAAKPTPAAAASH